MEGEKENRRVQRRGDEGKGGDGREGGKRREERWW